MSHAELLMLCPSRNRPAGAAGLITAWEMTSSPRSRLLIAVDDDDPQLRAYQHVDQTLTPQVPGVTFTYGSRLRLGGTLDALAARHAGEQFAIGFLGDDHRPRTPGWDGEFLEHLHAMGTGLVYGNDLLQGRNLPTQVAMTSNIPLALGYFATPGCTHLFFDNMWKQLGGALRAITYLPDVIIEHLHPFAGKAGMDDGYAEVNSDAMYAHDQEAYMAWVRDGFTGAVARCRAAARLAAAGPAA